MIKTTIVIPARYASTRLPGKPLIMLGGLTMLERVVLLSKEAASELDNVDVLVATDDNRIMQHCNAIGVTAHMTAPEIPSGTDRVAATIAQLDNKPDFVVNMQGDAPFTSKDVLIAIIRSFITKPCDVITPVVQLTWQQLDVLRANKLQTPFSGTTVTFHQQTGHALWFSKNIIPAIRKEDDLREKNTLSPVFVHIGVYGYALKMLNQYTLLPESHFEKLEGLEQLRLLENGYTIRCVPVACRENIAGIDSPEDIVRANIYLGSR